MSGRKVLWDAVSLTIGAVVGVGVFVLSWKVSDTPEVAALVTAAVMGFSPRDRTASEE